MGKKDASGTRLPTIDQYRKQIGESSLIRGLVNQFVDRQEISQL